VGFAWKPYVSVIWLLSFVGAQLFVLGIQGAYTSNEQFYLICGWVVANAVSLALSITMSEQTHAPKSCNSGTCH
jgi:NADH:ubiquinone oxidoreductase subunit K